MSTPEEKEAEKVADDSSRTAADSGNDEAPTVARPRDEEKGLNDADVAASTPVNPRANIALWRWVAVCLGIYLGALLYGESIALHNRYSP